ncbi:MAG: NigD-like C-terminal domain-containing protein [Bacteroidota bacterium]
MKTINYFFVTLLLVAIFSCDKEIKNEQDPSEIILKKGLNDYSVAVANRSSIGSDPFELKNIEYTGDSVKLIVSYSGGCNKHSFEFIWNEVISNSNPPEIDLIIQHESNGDACKAIITETLSVAINDLLDSLTFENMTVNVLNGCNPTDSIEYTGNEYSFKFAESDTCNVIVTAMNVACGTGLYNNIWFALDDSISAGIENIYFNKYLQPVSLNSSLAGFFPLSGKRYIIGGRIDNGNYNSGTVICMMYMGPSIPIKIMCIKEL